MKIETVNINVIKPYWRNPRNNVKAIEAVKKSISDYGYNVPIILDLENVIIAGHTRYLALKSLGYEDVICVYVDLPPDKAKEYRLVDNSTSELAEWDYGNLIPELREVFGVDDFIDSFFQTGKLDGWLDEILPDRENLSGFNSPTFNPSDSNYQSESQPQYTSNSVSERDISRTEDRLRDKFSNISNESNQDVVNLVCPECAATFGVRFSLLKSFLAKINAENQLS